MKEQKSNYIAVLLIFFLIIQCLGSMYFKSHNIDEPHNIARGVNILRNHNFDMSIAHPPLMNTLTGLPFLFLPNLKIPPTQFTMDFGYEFLYKNNYSADFLVFLSGIPTLIISVLLSVLIFRLAKKLYGSKAGIFALFLYVFNPGIIAYSTSTTTDMGIIFFSFLTIYCFLRFFKKSSVKNLVILSIVFGLALVTKYTSIFLIPLILLLFGFKFKKQIKTGIVSLFILILIAALIINISHGFSGTFMTFTESAHKDKLMNITRYDNILKDKPVISKVFNKVPLPLPYNYVRGFGSYAVHPEQSYYFFGEISYKGRWYYYPIVFLIKSPMSLLIFMGWAFLLFIKRKKLSPEEQILIISLIMITLFFMIKPFCTSGIRYFLPVMPFILILTSKIITVKKRTYQNYVILILCLFYAISSVLAFPNHMSFYNEFIGVDRGCKYSVDGDCDYGQGIRDIKKYMDKKNIDKIKLSYYGTADPDYYGINYEPLPSNDYVMTRRYGLNISMCQPTDGLIVISKLNLYRFAEKIGCFNWLKEHEPIDKINNNILVYNIIKK